MDSGGDIYPNREAWSHAHHVGGLLFLLILGLLLAAAVAWLANASMRQREEVRHAEARRAIYDDVRRAVDRALKSQGADLINASQRLVDTVRLRLGPLPEFGKTLTGSTDGITKALAGRITDPAKPAPPTTPTPPHAEGETTVIITPPSLTGTVNVIETPAPEKPEPPPAPVKPEERDMTLKEQLQALRLAVEAFAGAWQKDTVDAMLRAAQAALLDVRTSPSPDKH